MHVLFLPPRKKQTPIAYSVGNFWRLDGRALCTDQKKMITLNRHKHEKNLTRDTKLWEKSIWCLLWVFYLAHILSYIIWAGVGGVFLIFSAGAAPGSQDVLPSLLGCFFLSERRQSQLTNTTGPVGLMNTHLHILILSLSLTSHFFDSTTWGWGF